MDLKERLKKEIEAFRNEMQKLTSTEVYNKWYKIHFVESYYQMLSTYFVDETHPEVIDWLKNFNSETRILLFLYNEWLSADGAFSGDWTDMTEFIISIIEEEEML